MALRCKAYNSSLQTITWSKALVEIELPKESAKGFELQSIAAKVDFVTYLLSDSHNPSSWNGKIMAGEANGWL